MILDRVINRSTRSFLVLSSLMSMLGCGVKNNASFERTVQRFVGFPISYMSESTDLHDIVRMPNGLVEYHYETPIGCRWAYIVDGDGIIKSWRYIGPPGPCRQRVSWGSF